MWKTKRRLLWTNPNSISDSNSNFNVKRLRGRRRSFHGDSGKQKDDRNNEERKRSGERNDRILHHSYSIHDQFIMLLAS